MPSLTTIEQGAQLGAILANDYMIGALSEQAGIPGGAELQTGVVELLADLDLAVGAPESGFMGAAVVMGRLATTRAALTASASRGAALLAKDPKKWALAFGIAATGVGVASGSYMWLTEDQRVKIQQIDAAAAVQVEALKGMSPEQRTQLALELARSTMAGMPSNLWPWLIGGGLLAGYFVWRATR